MPNISNLPTNWHQVTLSQYYELVETEQMQWDSVLEKTMEQLAILLNTSADDDIILELEADAIFDAINNLKWLRKDIPTSVADEFNGLKLKPWNELNLGEFIDIENLIMANPEASIHMLASIIYKQHKTNEWGNIELEPYNYNINKRNEQFLNMPVTKAMGLLKSYLDFRTSFMSTYDSLFSDNSVNDTELDKQEQEELTGVDLLNHKKELQKQRIATKWAWESTIWGLSNQDITKFEAIFDTKLILVFNVLSMRHVTDK